MSGELSDVEGQQAAAQKQRDAELQLRSDLKSVMATPEGRRVCWWLIDGVTGSHGPSFAGEQPLTSAFHEGRRHVGITLRTRAQDWAQADYLRMLAEAHSDRLGLPPPK